MLRYWMDMSEAETAAALNCSVGSWQWGTDKPGTGLSTRGEQCFYDHGGTLANQFPIACDELSALQENGSSQGDPVSFLSTGDGRAIVFWGQVVPSVSYVTVRLGDAAVLTLHPATMYGARYVAFALPAHMVVDSATAYSRSGVIATAIPFQNPDGGLLTFLTWLRPGQAMPRRLTVALGSGTTGDQAWRATAYLGPWGTCLVAAGESDCFEPSQHPTTGAVVRSDSGVMGTAANSVSYLIITLKDGSTLRVDATEVGTEKFWGDGLSEKVQTGAHWTAYDAEGKVVSSGRIVYLQLRAGPDPRRPAGSRPRPVT